MLRDTTSRGLCVRVWPPHTSERRGGGGGCEQEVGKEVRGAQGLSGLAGTGGATTPHPSMLRLIRIAAVLAAARWGPPLGNRTQNDRVGADELSYQTIRGSGAHQGRANP